MPRVYFWNAEHLSNNAAIIAADAQAQLLRDQRNEVRRLRTARDPGIATAPVTRGTLRDGTSARMHHGVKPVMKKTFTDRTLKRLQERETRLMMRIEQSTRDATIRRNKLETQTWLDNRGHPVFYCEVQQGFAGYTSSLRTAVAPGPATLCYKANGVAGLADPVGTPVPGTGIMGAGGGPFLTPGSSRIPKHVVVGGVNLFFWHAPSGNSGQVVAAIWGWINANYPGAACILFGDLNAEPGQLMAHGVPAGDIVNSGAPTRISGRTLDYALSNQPGVTVNRAFDAAVPHREIKTRFGSDHAAMRIDW